jgi:hypothetical protein
VTDNQLGPAAGAISKHKARKYRQYMNRKGIFVCFNFYRFCVYLNFILGGFNKPLAKID